MNVLGDVVISVDTTARQAAERGYTLLDEARVLLVHGVLHLLGYDHEEGEWGCAGHKQIVLQKLLPVHGTLRLGWLCRGFLGTVEPLHVSQVLAVAACHLSVCSCRPGGGGGDGGG